MKVKLSITLDNETLKLIDEHVNSQRFRNKSHAIEFAIRKLLEQKIAEQKNAQTQLRNEFSMKKPDRSRQAKLEVRGYG